MTFSSKLAAHVLAVAKAPITATCFAGEDVRYAAAYELLEQELGKASSLHAAGSVDWEAVREGSEDLLSTQTKDLRIAAWLTWSLYQRDSFLGLHAGLSMLGFFCRDHWDDIHPRKDRTRTAAITWLVPRMEQVLADHVPMGEQLPLFEQIAVELRSLEGCLAAKLGTQAPLLLPLCRRLEEMVKRAGAAHPQPGAVGAAIAQVKQVAAQVFTATTPVEHEKDAHKSLRSLQDQARSAHISSATSNATGPVRVSKATPLSPHRCRSFSLTSAFELSAVQVPVADVLDTTRYSESRQVGGVHLYDTRLVTLFTQQPPDRRLTSSGQSTC